MSDSGSSSPKSPKSPSATSDIQQPLSPLSTSGIRSPLSPISSTTRTRSPSVSSETFSLDRTPCSSPRRALGPGSVSPGGYADPYAWVTSPLSPESHGKLLRKRSENVPPSPRKLDPRRSPLQGFPNRQRLLQPGQKRSASSPLKPLNRMVPSPKKPLTGKGNCGGVASTSTDNSRPNKVVYIYSANLVRLCDQLLKVPRRASIIHGLIEAYGLLQHMTVKPPLPTGKEELTAFHSQDFIDCLEKLNHEEDSEKDEELQMQFGLGYDCPIMPLVYDFSCAVAGATLQAAQSLIDCECRVAINWFGGWHHAKRDEAAGFCYVNDVVLGILKLREKFDKVLYIDVDLHHGDGVEDAFCFTPKVMTVSFHKYCPGFYPGTGTLQDVGTGKGKYYSVNVPLKDGITEEQYCHLFTNIMDEIYTCYSPDALALQCGVDTIADDPMQSFNLTPAAVAKCLRHVLDWSLPTLVVGGGGYNLANSARSWAYLTASVLDHKLPAEIPEHEYFLEYGPGYQLDISPSHLPNLNRDDYLEQVSSTIMRNVQNVR